MSRKHSTPTEEIPAVIEGVASVETEVGPLDTLAEEPAQPGLVARGVYRATYAVSFGVVFGSLLIAKAIPKNSVVDKAIHDGAVAAQKSLVEKEHFIAETVEETREFLSGGEPEPALG